MFECKKCGICCRNISQINLLKYLDDGTGKCKYLDSTTNLCSVYDNRPIICNVDKCYEVFFSHIYSLEEYYELNYEVCKKLSSKGAN